MTTESPTTSEEAKILDALKSRFEETDRRFGVDGYTIIPIEARIARLEQNIEHLLGALICTLKLPNHPLEQPNSQAKTNGGK